MRGVAVVIIMLIIAAMYVDAQPRPEGIAYIVPIGRHRELDVNLWPAAGGVRAVVWHQDTVAGTNTKIATVDFPAWGLTLMAGPLALLLLWAAPLTRALARMLRSA